MVNFFITCFTIIMSFLIGGIFYSHLQGLKKAKTSVTEAPPANNPLYSTEQHQIASETEAKRKKMMEDMKFQIDSQLQRNNPASRGF